MIKLRLHADDEETIELYSDRKGKVVIWGIMHTDALREVDLTVEDLENCEYSLEAKAITSKPDHKKDLELARLNLELLGMRKTYSLTASERERLNKQYYEALRHFNELKFKGE